MVRCGTVTVLVAAGALLLLLFAVPAASAASRSVTTPAVRAAAATAAQAKVGARYHRGAAGPNRFDCSGLVAFAYRRAGRPLPARSSFELFRIGARVQRAALRPGDLVWTWDRRLGHVGIYVGRGRYVHAPGSGRRVEVVPLPAGAAFIGAVRP